MGHCLNMGHCNNARYPTIGNQCISSNEYCRNQACNFIHQNMGAVDAMTRVVKDCPNPISYSFSNSYLYTTKIHLPNNGVRFTQFFYQTNFTYFLFKMQCKYLVSLYISPHFNTFYFLFLPRPNQKLKLKHQSKHRTFTTC